MRRRWVVWLLVFSGRTALAVFFAVSSSLTFVSTYQPPRWRLTLLTPRDGSRPRTYRAKVEQVLGREQ